MSIAMDDLNLATFKQLAEDVPEMNVEIPILRRWWEWPEDAQNVQIVEGHSWWLYPPEFVVSSDFLLGYSSSS